MFKYTMSNGEIITSKLNHKELMLRLNRLDTLRVLTETSEIKEVKSICYKALNAFNKTNSFTGIIRLTLEEKEGLSYMLENDMLGEEYRGIINFYINRR